MKERLHGTLEEERFASRLLVFCGLVELESHLSH